MSDVMISAWIWYPRWTQAELTTLTRLQYVKSLADTSVLVGFMSKNFVSILDFEFGP